MLVPGGLIAADKVAMAPNYIAATTQDTRLDTVFFGRFAVTVKNVDVRWADLFDQWHESVGRRRLLSL